MAMLKIKKGDTVKVIAGKDKDKEGKVIAVDHKNGRVTVEGVNMLTKHTKIAIIDKESKKTILKELFRLGITFENIYPDKDNMVKTIRFIKENM